MAARLADGSDNVRHAVADERVLPQDSRADLTPDVPVVSKTPGEAADHFGWFASFAAIDALPTSEKTQTLLDCYPTQPWLIAGLEQPHYFAS